MDLSNYLIFGEGDRLLGNQEDPPGGLGVSGGVGIVGAKKP